MSSTSSRSWTPAIARDTRPEVAAALHARRLGQSEVERFDEGLRWMGHRFQIVYDVLAREHPEAPHYELAALWNERMYRGRMPDDVLDRALAEIRRRGEAGEPPFDK